MLAELGEADAVKPIAHDFTALRRRHTFLAQPETYVVGDGKPRKQGIGLENHSALRPGNGDRHAAQNDLPGAGPIKAGDKPQQGGFAAARGADDRHEVVVCEGEIGRLERPRWRSPAHAWESARDAPDHQLAQARLQGNSRRFAHLNRKSEMSPMMPMTMMPKMICPVASKAWLSMIMCPMPDEDPINSATIT